MVDRRRFILDLQHEARVSALIKRPLTFRFKVIMRGGVIREIRRLCHTLCSEPQLTILYVWPIFIICPSQFLCFKAVYDPKRTLGGDTGYQATVLFQSTLSWQWSYAAICEMFPIIDCVQSALLTLCLFLFTDRHIQVMPPVQGFLWSAVKPGSTTLLCVPLLTRPLILLHVPLSANHGCFGGNDIFVLWSFILSADIPYLLASLERISKQLRFLPSLRRVLYTTSTYIYSSRHI